MMEALRADFLWNLSLTYLLSRNSNFLLSAYENLVGNGFLIFELWAGSMFHLLLVSPTFVQVKPNSIKK